MGNTAQALAAAASPEGLVSEEQQTFYCSVSQVVDRARSFCSLRFQLRASAVSKPPPPPNAGKLNRDIVAR